MRTVSRILLVGLLMALGLKPGAAFDASAFDRLLRSRTCVGCDLYRANFNRLDLSGVDLRKANLGFATFRQATLYLADLEGADVRGTDFTGALWTDGRICGPGSIGICAKKSTADN